MWHNYKILWSGDYITFPSPWSHFHDRQFSFFGWHTVQSWKSNILMHRYILKYRSSSRSRFKMQIFYKIFFCNKNWRHIQNYDFNPYVLKEDLSVVDLCQLPAYRQIYELHSKQVWTGMGGGLEGPKERSLNRSGSPHVVKGLGLGGGVHK